MFGKLPSSYRNHGNYDATVSKSQNVQMQLVRLFVLQNMKTSDTINNKMLNNTYVLHF